MKNRSGSLDIKPNKVKKNTAITYLTQFSIIWKLGRKIPIWDYLTSLVSHKLKKHIRVMN